MPRELKPKPKPFYLEHALGRALALAEQLLREVPQNNCFCYRTGAPCFTHGEGRAEYAALCKVAGKKGRKRWD